jgi:hypothetical protein
MFDILFWTNIWYFFFEHKCLNGDVNTILSYFRVIEFISRYVSQYFAHNLCIN